MKNPSTAQVARIIGVNKTTLLRWLYKGAIKEPKRHENGGQTVRLWNARDVETARKYKEANYRKGRGRKKKTKK